jgi:hypothetical protein
MIMNEEELIIKSVEEGDTYYTISAGSSGFGLEKSYGVKPKKGDRVKLYTIKVSEIRGMDINGVRVFYKSDAQLEKERKEWVEKYNKGKLETFEKNKASLDSDYASLPKIFQKRIDKFRKNNPNFRVEYEDYEMFCCKEALKIAEYVQSEFDKRELSDRCFKKGETKGLEYLPPTADINSIIKNFYDLPFEKQVKLAQIDGGHSGNTFGMACRLAGLYLSSSENVEKLHGALAPLVGSEEYGCVPKKGRKHG